MPIYEYRCQACGHELEAMQRISADPLTSCPQCAKDGLKRLISQTSFVLKGSGWYATDYAGKKPAPASGSESSGSEGSASSGDSSTSSGGDSASTSSPSSSE